MATRQLLNNRSHADTISAKRIGVNLKPTSHCCKARQFETNKTKKIALKSPLLPSDNAALELRYYIQQIFTCNISANIIYYMN